MPRVPMPPIRRCNALILYEQARNQIWLLSAACSAVMCERGKRINRVYTPFASQPLKGKYDKALIPRLRN